MKKLSLIFVLTSLFLSNCTVDENSLMNCETHVNIKMLTAINEARARGYTCNGEYYPPVEPVYWNEKLESAAIKHANDMAQNDFFAHMGTDGSFCEQRVSTTGYSWKMVGENIAAGFEESDVIVAQWLNSPAHCHIIMHPDFLEVGAACSCNSDSTYGTYWTVVLGYPQ